MTESRISLRRATLVVALAGGIGIAVGAGLYLLDSHRSPSASADNLPAFHGQATWGPGTRDAAGFTLRDQSGGSISLASLRGRPVLLTFLDSRCKQECPIQGRQLASILWRLPAARRPALLIVSVDPSGDTPASIRHAMTRWGLAGPWTWHWLNGARSRLAAVWHRYGVTVDPSSGDIVHSLVLYLIDRDGYQRTAYLYPFLPGFVQGDLARLAGAAA